MTSNKIKVIELGVEIHYRMKWLCKKIAKCETNYVCSDLFVDHKCVLLWKKKIVKVRTSFETKEFDREFINNGSKITFYSKL